jgi:integrase/recombinase XerC
MTALTVFPGGGKSSDALKICTLCGVPHQPGCRILARHLDWMALRGLSATTIYARKGALRRLGAALPVPVIVATAADLYEWRAHLGGAAQTTLQAVSSAKQFYLWAIAEGLRTDNPAGRLPVPRPPRMLPRPIAEDDLMAALEQAPPRIRPWIVLAAWCGLRAKEIAFLRAENIHLENEMPMLLVASDATKGSRERLIPLSAWVVGELAAAKLPTRGYAFRRHDGARGPNAPWLVSHLVSDFLRDCGIPATAHSMRHRFGTRTYRACRDIRAVQDLMGHLSPETTAGYAAYDNAAGAAAVEALPVPRRLHAVDAT